MDHAFGPPAHRSFAGLKRAYNKTSKRTSGRATIHRSLNLRLRAKCRACGPPCASAHAQSPSAPVLHLRPQRLQRLPETMTVENIEVLVGHRVRMLEMRNLGYMRTDLFQRFEIVVQDD